MALYRPPATGWLHKMAGQQVALEGYSGRPVEMQANYRRDSHLKCFERAPVVGVHDGPVLEV
jgi:hypothetical protein